MNDQAASARIVHVALFTRNPRVNDGRHISDLPHRSLHPV